MKVTKGHCPWVILLGRGRVNDTSITYHRTWETGLGVEIRVAAFSPDFIWVASPEFRKIELPAE